MNCPRCSRPIDEHESGPETDACVAVVVMGSNEPIYAHSAPHIESIYTNDGYWYCSPDYYEGDKCEWRAVPFSTSINYAWEVVEKIGDTQLPKHVGRTMLHRLRQCSIKGWGVIFCSDFGYTNEVFAPMPELAICRAALKAVTNDDN